MSELTTGQDVIVESESVLGGEAFIGSVDALTSETSGDTVVVRRGTRDETVYHVHTDEVVTLTEVFDSIDRNA